MKFRILIFSFLTLNTSHAASISVKAKIQVGGDNISEISDADAKALGWGREMADSDQVFTLDKVVPESKLPLNLEIGEVYFRISKSGLVSTGISVGDADAGGEAAFQWPMIKNKLAPLTYPVTFTGEGGDYASGAWSYSATVTIEYKK